MNKDAKKIETWFDLFRILVAVLVAYVIALVILLIIGKPLWIAPVVGVVVYLLYRLVLTAILNLLR
jgi:hypothetical protein